MHSDSLFLHHKHSLTGIVDFMEKDSCVVKTHSNHSPGSGFMSLLCYETHCTR